MCDAVYRWRHLVKATEVTAGLSESNGSLLPGLWRDSLHVTSGLTACTPGSAPGPTLGNEYGKTLLYLFTLLHATPTDVWRGEGTVNPTRRPTKRVARSVCGSRASGFSKHARVGLCVEWRTQNFRLGAGTSAGFWLGGQCPLIAAWGEFFFKFDYEMVHSEVYLNK